MAMGEIGRPGWLDAGRYPHAARMIAAVLADWPEHERFLSESFARRDAALLHSTDRVAATILAVIGMDEALRRYAGDYRFLCGRMLEEELHFRRSGHYRLSRFADALAQVYDDPVFMDRYMNFLLLTQVLLSNHAEAIANFEQSYLPRLPAGTRHLEIGPGHGLLLHSAAQSPQIATLTGWDISATSIAQTRACLDAMAVKKPVALVLQDLFAAKPASSADAGFGSVVLAEILEHLEDPHAALRAVSGHMAPGGWLWVHVPINSPAPDHLYLLRTPEAAVDLVRSAGFEPVEQAFFPMSGQTLERARKRDLTISAVIHARKPA